MKISLDGMDKARVLMALYDASRPQGMGILHFNPLPMTAEEVGLLLEVSSCFDYLHGRVMKIDLGGGTLDTWLYDRDNGPGAARRALEAAGMKVVVLEE